MMPHEVSDQGDKESVLLNFAFGEEYYNAYMYEAEPFIVAVT